jgi:hypothetical protein
MLDQNSALNKGWWNYFKNGFFSLWNGFLRLFNFSNSPSLNSRPQAGAPEQLLIISEPSASPAPAAALSSETPGGELENFFSDPAAFKGKDVIQGAINSIFMLEVLYDEARVDHDRAFSSIGQHASAASTAEQISKRITRTEQALVASEKQLRDQSGHAIEQIVTWYKSKAPSDPRIMDGIKNLLSSAQAPSILVSVFSKLKDNNLLTDQRVIMIGTLLENNDRFLTMLDDLVHQDADIQAKNLEELLTTGNIINLVKVHPNLQYQPVPGDGNCMYSSVLFYIKSSETSQQLRASMAAYVEKNQDKYAETPPNLMRDKQQYASMEDYLNALRNTRDYAESIDVMILMDMLERPIAIVGPDGKIRNAHIVEAKSKVFPKANPIFIYYNGVNHYSGLIIKDEKDPKELLNELMHPEAQKLPVLNNV